MNSENKRNMARPKKVNKQGNWQNANRRKAKSKHPTIMTALLWTQTSWLLYQKVQPSSSVAPVIIHGQQCWMLHWTQKQQHCGSSSLHFCWRLWTLTAFSPVMSSTQYWDCSCHSGCSVLTYSSLIMEFSALLTGWATATTAIKYLQMTIAVEKFWPTVFCRIILIQPCWKVFKWEPTKS